MGRDTLIWQEDLNTFILELHTFCRTNPLAITDNDEGYDNFASFIEERFDKFWPGLYTGHYRNYN